jgi:hypothetical protein
MAKIRPKLAELEVLEGGGAGGMGGGGGRASGVGGTKWSNLPSFKGKANAIDDIRRLSKDTSNLKGGAKGAADEAKQRAANRTAVRAAGLGAVGTGVKSMMDDDEPAEETSKGEKEDNFQEAKRVLREVDAETKASKYGKGEKMASGGMTSSASKRADGIATKGKTRGKMC